MKAICKNSYVLNFLSGDIVYLIDRFIYDKSIDNLNRILKVLNYIGKKQPNPSKKKKKNPIDIKARLSKIDSYLSKLNNLPKLAQPPYAINKEKFKTSILLCETKDFSKGVLSIYTNYQQTFPRSDLILFCHFSTEWLEIKRFINRCVLNPENEIYTLVHSEKLTLENQIKIDSKLNRLIRRKQFFSLAIVTNDSDSKLISNLRYNTLIEIEKLKKLKMLNDIQTSSLVQKNSPHVVVVTSDYTGVGISELIKKTALKKCLPLIEINISAT